MDKRNPFRPNYARRCKHRQEYARRLKTGNRKKADRRVRRIRNPYRIMHRRRPGVQNLIARMDEIERTQRALAKRFKQIERMLGAAIAKSFRSRRAR